jgi:hypothetical protein
MNGKCIGSHQLFVSLSQSKTERKNLLTSKHSEKPDQKASNAFLRTLLWEKH